MAATTGELGACGSLRSQCIGSARDKSAPAWFIEAANEGRRAEGRAGVLNVGLEGGMGRRGGTRGAR